MSSVLPPVEDTYECNDIYALQCMLFTVYQFTLDEGLVIGVCSQVCRKWRCALLCNNVTARFVLSSSSFSSLLLSQASSRARMSQQAMLTALLLNTHYSKPPQHDHLHRDFYHIVDTLLSSDNADQARRGACAWADSEVHNSPFELVSPLDADHHDNMAADHVQTSLVASHYPTGTCDNLAAWCRQRQPSSSPATSSPPPTSHSMVSSAVETTVLLPHRSVVHLVLLHRKAWALMAVGHAEGKLQDVRVKVARNLLLQRSAAYTTNASMQRHRSLLPIGGLHKIALLLGVQSVDYTEDALLSFLHSPLLAVLRVATGGVVCRGGRVGGCGGGHSTHLGLITHASHRLPSMLLHGAHQSGPNSHVPPNTDVVSNRIVVEVNRSATIITPTVFGNSRSSMQASVRGCDNSAGNGATRSGNNQAGNPLQTGRGGRGLYECIALISLEYCKLRKNKLVSSKKPKPKQKQADNAAVPDCGSSSRSAVLSSPYYAVGLYEVVCLLHEYFNTAAEYQIFLVNAERWAQFIVNEN